MPELSTSLHTTTKRPSRVFTGVVVSDGMEKTLIVRVQHIQMHPKYKKQYRVYKRYPVHDQKKEYREGDVVRFEECRPLSKTKHWRVLGRA